MGTKVRGESERNGYKGQRRIREEWVQRSEENQRGMGTEVRVIMDLLGLL